ncbi:hypothetical protein CUU95_02160 [Vreelandella alkaliphila]|uniref:ABC-three component system protein n=1 Tax=Vreelandella alkaliphila TaxID=272774 RepID=UPI000EA1FFF9|nr:ABC-three component system protein [Halomonas alkaliphila]AYF32699.1 hypothetical protein CUU95_02160 [Halomonas alkaliphila]
MSSELNNPNAHSADASALGFLYQSQWALLRLWNEESYEAAVYIETLDDVVLEANGQTILEQLKHSLLKNPPAITLASVNLWKTLKAWIDVLPDLDLSNTSLHLVTVADISPTSPLRDLLDDSKNREGLLNALQEEAHRVIHERNDAKANGEKRLPHKNRAPGCESFLNLSDDMQATIISRVQLKPAQKNICQIEEELARRLTAVPVKDQPNVARLMVEWWSRQIIHAHCGKRSKAIHRFELVQKHAEIVADIKHDQLVDHFSAALPPDTYKSHPMVENQINLVNASKGWLQRVITNEWRSRESRSRWVNENPTWQEKISYYDRRLQEEWSYVHEDMCEECSEKTNEEKEKKGHELLKWSFYKAPEIIEPIAPTVISPSYVRGTYQVLSISGKVGWHPDYLSLLEFKK